MGGLLERLRGFGFGLSGLVPFIVYYISGVIAILAAFVNPIIGIYFLFPLLPYQAIFTKMNQLPLGKDVYMIIMAAIAIGWFFHKGKGTIRSNQKRIQPAEYNSLKAAIIFHCVVITIGLIVALLNPSTPEPLPGRSYLGDWKNYMLFPFIWFLTTNVIKDRKQAYTLTLLLVLGIFGVDRYYYSNLGFMNTWHYSEKTKDAISGLFVYLGANHYGSFFAHFIFPLVGLMLFVRSKFKKIILFLIIWLTGYCLLFTYSRGAYLALILGLLFIGLVKDKKILVLVILSLIFWKSLAPISVRERIEMTQNQETGELEESAAIRIQLWEHAKGMFNSSPIIGQGFNTFQFSGLRDAHNLYMKMLAELGILGLSSFLYLCFASFMIAWKLFRESTENLYKGLGLGFCACVLSVMASNGFGDRWSYLPLSAYYWVFLGLVTKALLLTMEEKSLLLDKEKNKPKFARFKKTGLAEQQE